MLIITSIIFCCVCLFFLSKQTTSYSFYQGRGDNNQSPSVFALTLSQATSWIFARSLLNAAILGFYFGFWGTFAYALYYLSFLSGWKIVDSIRFKHNHPNIQSFLFHRYGQLGTALFNFLIILRLISEVFANLLVVGLLFGDSGSNNYILAILLFSLFTLAYSAKGGLSASILTDKFQMIIFIILLTLLFVFTQVFIDIDFTSIISASFVVDETTQPGVILMLVALLQFISYPMHDPVMMDRGFIADRETTKKSFLYAFIISFISIIVFGTFGIIAAFFAQEGMSMQASLENLMGPIMFLMFNLCLIISSLSTLDSTLSSAAKLYVVDMNQKIFKRYRASDTVARNKAIPEHPSVFKGRVVMVVFMLLGLFLLSLGNQDLFSAVAVSGTASLFLLPVITFQILGNTKNIPPISLFLSFVLSFLGAALYFLESSKGTNILPSLFGNSHKYSKLLIISFTLVCLNHLVFYLGYLRSRSKQKINA